MNSHEQRIGIVGISTKCNLNCVFCLDADTKGRSEPTFAQFQAEIRRMKAQRVKEITYMTCESLLRKDFFDIVRYVDSQRIGQQLITNGTLLADEGFFNKLVESPLRGIELSVSSFDATSSLRIHRNRHAWARQMKAMENIARYNHENPGDKFFFTVRLLVTRMNLSRIELILKTIGDICGGEWNIYIKFIQVMLWKPQVQKALLPSPEELRSGILQALPYVRKNFEDRRVLFNNFPLCFLKGMEECSRELKDIIQGVQYYQAQPHTRDALRRAGVFKNYHKPLSCIICQYDSFCPGFWGDFLKGFNVKMLYPVQAPKREFHFSARESFLTLSELKRMAGVYRLAKKVSSKNRRKVREESFRLFALRQKLYP